MRQWVVATGNAHKMAELRTLLADLPVRLLSPDDLPAERQFEPAEETGATFRENADLKALHAARIAGIPACADDSGLEVDALDGRPGVRSARYAGAGATLEEPISRRMVGFSLWGRGSRRRVRNTPSISRSVTISDSWKAGARSTT